MIVNVCILLSISLAVIYVGACLYAHFFADSMIFPAPPSSYRDSEKIIKLQTENQDTISATYLPAEQRGPLLIYSHGNGEDLGEIRGLLIQYQRQGISVLAYDYPGYGTSSGTASETSVFAAIEATYDYARDTLDYSPEEIVLYGRSLGSGPSVWLAEKQDVAGLILDGAFSSTFRVMTRIKLLPFDTFDNVARLPQVQVPTLLLHGEMDQVVPFSHALQNERAAGGPIDAVWVEKAGHNDLIEVLGESYWNQTISFIRKHTTHEH